MIDTRSPEPLPLVLDGVSKRYGQIRALDSVSLTVLPGDIYGFLGRNGAGKSTAIKIIAGLVRHDAGEIRLFGDSASSSRPAARRRVGFLIENPAFFPGLNALENMECHSLLLGRRAGEARIEIQACLEQVGLAKDAHRRVGEYSTGMRQRLGLAQALLGDPELVVLDEPLNGLDPEGIVHMRDLIQGRAKERGTTFFLSSHILAEVERLCTRVGFLRTGKMVAEGSCRELGAAGWIRLRISSPERAEAALQRRWPEVFFRKSPNGPLALRLDESEVPELVRCLVEEGLDLYEVTPSPRSLEELFMELTGEEKDA